MTDLLQLFSAGCCFGRWPLKSQQYCLVFQQRNVVRRSLTIVQSSCWPHLRLHSLASLRPELEAFVCKLGTRQPGIQLWSKWCRSRTNPRCGSWNRPKNRCHGLRRELHKGQRSSCSCLRGGQYSRWLFRLQVSAYHSCSLRHWAKLQGRLWSWTWW